MFVFVNLEFWCKAVSGDEVLAGSTYVTPNYFGFTAPYNNQHVVVLIPFNTVLDIKPASPVISPSGQTVFEMTSSPGPSTTCIQIYTSDQLVCIIFLIFILKKLIIGIETSIF